MALLPDATLNVCANVALEASLTENMQVIGHTHGNLRVRLCYLTDGANVLPSPSAQGNSLAF